MEPRWLIGTCFRRLAVASLALVVSASAAHAQSFPYAGAGIALSPWKPGYVSFSSPSTTYDNVSLEAWNTALVAEAGWSFGRRTEIGAEFVLPLKRKSVVQEYAYAFSPYVRDSRYRERTLHLVLRQHVASAGRLHFNAVAGAGVAMGHSLDRYARQIPGTGQFGPFGDEVEDSDSMLSMTAGADTVIAAGAHVRVMPQFRAVVVRRGGRAANGSAFSTFGLPTTTYRVGVTVRLES